MKKKAFTLAEVLITLGIIGVIAAMTMPMINNKYREIKTVSKLTQTYSILQQAFQLAIKDESGPGSWNIIASSASGANNMAKPLISQMKLSQDCGTTSNPTIGQNCISNTKMKYLNGNQFNGNTWNLAREGNTYKVEWNGNVYECVAYKVTDAELVWIGNATIIGEHGGNGEPFLVGSADISGLFSLL